MAINITDGGSDCSRKKLLCSGSNGQTEGQGFSQDMELVLVEQQV
jgi:hypothetical protein